MSSPRQRAALWSREAAAAYFAGQGRHPLCNLCSLPILPGDDWDESHAPAKPRCFGGRSTGIAHRRCNREHGAAVVTPTAAKAARVHERHIGARAPGLGRHAMPGGRRSPVSKTIAGRVMPRLTAAEKHRRAMAARAIGMEALP